MGWIGPFLLGHQTASISVIEFIFSSGVWYSLGFDESSFMIVCFILIRVLSNQSLEPNFGELIYITRKASTIYLLKRAYFGGMLF